MVHLVQEARDNGHAYVDDDYCEFFMGAADVSNVENNRNVEVLVNGSSMFLKRIVERNAKSYLWKY